MGHDIFTYIFAGGFTDVNWKLPGVMDFIEAFSDLGSFSAIMGALAELNSWEKFEPGALFDEAGHLSSLSMALSLLKAIVIALNQAVSFLAEQASVPMMPIGKILQGV